jgi:hypothetical protein
MAPKVVAAWKRFTKIRMKVKNLLQAEEQLKGRLTHLQEQLQGAINEMERVVRYIHSLGDFGLKPWKLCGDESFDDCCGLQSESSKLGMNSAAELSLLGLKASEGLNVSMSNLVELLITGSSGVSGLFIAASTGFSGISTSMSSKEGTSISSKGGISIASCPWLSMSSLSLELTYITLL